MPLRDAGDWAVWQRAFLDEVMDGDETRMQHQLAYWREVLDDAPVLELPCDHARPSHLPLRGGTAAAQVGPDASVAFMALCQRSAVTALHGVMAAWSVLLCKHSAQDDVVMGVPYANRGDDEAQGVIGYFINTLAVRVKPSRDISVVGLLSSVKQTMLDALAHGDVPFVEVARSHYCARPSISSLRPCPTTHPQPSLALALTSCVRRLCTPCCRQDLTRAARRYTRPSLLTWKIGMPLPT